MNRFIGLALVLTLCTQAVAAKKPATKPLYDRLGKKAGITKVVDTFAANLQADTRINSFFSNTDMPRFKARLVDQICEASHGRCKYTGKDMKAAHAGMGIKEEHFIWLVEDLTKALDTHKVAEKEKAELLAILGPMKAEVVEIGPAASAKDAGPGTTPKQ